MKQINSNMKSVKSKNQCQLVIQTMYDFVKAHHGEIKVKSLSAGEVGTKFIINLPVNG